MTEREAADVLDPPGFESFAALRRWHSEQLKRLRTEGPLNAEVARHYVHAVQASGANIRPEDERLSAQDILDYWSAELISAAPSENQSWSPPHLARFASTEDGFEPRQEVGEAASDAAKARIRLAAGARLWRDTGHARGYLLFGQALADAKRFQDDDPDVAELIKASEAYNQWLARNWRIANIVAVTALVVAAIAFYSLWRKADSEAERARISERTAREAQMQSEVSRNTAEELRREATLALGRYTQNYKNAVDVEALNKALLDLVRREVEQQRLSQSLLPPNVRSAITRLTTPQVVEQNPDAAPPPSGYAADFLGTPSLPMPVHADGRTVLAYPNYSILMHRSRRIALAAASNMDRRRLRALPRVHETYDCDTRLPCDQQADPAWFTGGFDRGHLVPRSQVAWGPAIEGSEPEVASFRLMEAVNRFPNITPQFDTFNRGVWNGAERWALADHNKAAPRLTVFTGPVLRDDDPIISGVQTPRAFWKVVASGRLERAGGLVVDAFIVPQIKDGTAGKADSTTFEPNWFRTTVADIEQATGLDFGSELRRAAIRAPRAAPPMEGADRVSELNNPHQQTRVATTQRLVAALRNPEAAEDNKRLLVAAAAALASDDGATLSPSGRINLLVLLLEAPTAAWNKPDWLDSKALVRRMVATLEAQAGVTTEPIGPQAAELIAKLKANLDWDLPKGRTVHFQFSGIGQPDARAISQDLRALGWSIPGEEGVGTARARNGVYYADPADLPAALLLAADLRAQGQQQVGPPQPIKGGKRGTLEAWVSP